MRTFEDFIKVDIYTGDSDPVYFAIHRAYRELDPNWARRFCVAMLTYYHTGTAAEAANYEGNDFWDYLESVYDSAPRASERRHFRGDAGKAGLLSMRLFSPIPDQFFLQFGSNYKDIKDLCAAKLSQFGPYFVLKIADYMDRCLEMPIHSYDGLASNLPSEPLKCIKLLYPERRVDYAFNHLCGRVAQTGLLAGPSFDRPAGPAEVETSLCGWKTTKYKGNWFGADIDDKRKSLIGFGPNADLMRSWMPEVPPRNLFVCEL